MTRTTTGTGTGTTTVTTGRAPHAAGLHQLLRDSARRDPHALALAGPDGRLRYDELDRLADRYGTALRARGVRPGDRVVIWSGKGVHPVAVMQAALRVGAVYVPVTGSNPPARLARIAAGCAPALVVADDETLERARRQGWAGAGPGTAPVSFADLRATGGAGGPATAGPDHPARPDDPAYILYTSGSTGEPKGVCVSHRGARTFIDWAVAELGVRAADRLSNHAPFAFDLSVFDLYAAFAAGASVHLVPEELSYAPQQLALFMREQRISVWYSVPSALSLMIREGRLLAAGPPPALRACVFAGEPFAVDHVQALRRQWPRVRLLNWYGPTETNVCTSYEVGVDDLKRDTPLPIGRACADAAVTLDAPAGEEGEVVVSGPTVMLGYWGHAPQRGPYRTGDLARLSATGDLEYAGRRDHLVKVRGHRIELGEIEAAISSLDTVAEAVVLAVGSGLATRLEAAVVPAPGARPSVLSVKRRCAERLPTYMTVDRLHLRPDLPRTANGKTDRTALAVAAEAGTL